MITDQQILDRFDEAITTFSDAKDFRDLVAGQLSRNQLRAFIRHVFIAHYQSAHILAFGYALLASEASATLQENMLEEMGEADEGVAHPTLLVDLARGAGFSDPEISDLKTAAGDHARAFCAQALPFATLRDVGLAVLIETALFEHFLSRFAEVIGGALRDHYQVPTDALAWFALHGELDIRHAAESIETILAYVDFHRIDQAQFERVIRAVFRNNPLATRYFPPVQSLDLAPAGQITAIKIYHLHIPFRAAFRHAQADRSASDAVVVRVQDAQGQIGYGEGVARDYVTGETVASVIQFIEQHLAPWVFALRITDGSDAWEQITAYQSDPRWDRSRANEPVNNAAFAAVELALLDWAHRRTGHSVASKLVPVRAEVAYSGVISAEDPTAAGALAMRFVDAGIDTLKLKVGVGDDLGRLRAVRQAVGDQVSLRVDANGAWEVAEAVDRIAALLPFGIAWVEQPISHRHPGHVQQLTAVRRQVPVPIMADESLLTANDAQALIAAGACDYFNIRVSKNGGLVNAAAIAGLARSAGIRVQIGAQVGETAILSAAGRHLAAHVPDLAAAEGSFGTWLLAEDLAEGDVRFGIGGVAPALAGPGLGVTINESTLDRLTVAMVEVRP